MLEISYVNSNILDILLSEIVIPWNLWYGFTYVNKITTSNYYNDYNYTKVWSLSSAELINKVRQKILHLVAIFISHLSSQCILV